MLLHWNVKCRQRIHNQEVQSALSGGDDLPVRTASCKRSPSSLSGGGEEEAQEEAPGAEPQFLFHGREVPRML